jgi:hypothetical protein
MGRRDGEHQARSPKIRECSRGKDYTRTGGKFSVENSKGVSPREKQQDKALMENSKGVSPREKQQDKALMVIPFRSFLRSLGSYIDTEVHPAILHAVTLLIPVNVYVIGDWIGAGIQWALFRYQVTTYGTSIISILTDGGYILNGALQGRTAFSIGLWILGTILLIAAFLAALFSGDESSARLRGFALVSGTLLLLLSSIVQYGPFLNGPAGFAVPVGIPVLFMLGFLISGGKEEFL